MPDGVNVFVLHWEHDDVTNTCVASWMPECQRHGARLIVIDNGSRKPYHTNLAVEVVRHERNLFLIEAFNRVMQDNPAGVYVACTNDTKIGRGSLGILLEALGDRKIGVVAPGTNDQGAGVLTVTEATPANTRQYTGHVDNTCWAWRHDVVEAVGWPDCVGHTHRACWASNQDFCYRVRMAGYRVLAVRDAFLWHAHDGGMDTEAWQAGRRWLELKWGEKAAEVWR